MPSVNDNIEIHLLALAITLVLNKYVKLHKTNWKDSCRKLDRIAVYRAIEEIVNLFQTDDWREMLEKGLHYG